MADEPKTDTRKRERFTMNRKMNIKKLAMRFSDGGAQPPAEPTPAPATPGVTPAAAAQNAPTAVNVDIDSIVSQAAAKAAELAEKKNESVFKSMLQQSGLDDAAIQSMLAEYKAKQVTPEQTIQQLNGDIAARDAQITAFQRRDILRGHGLTDAEEIEVMGIRIERLVTEGKDFAAAAQEYFTANPRPTKPPASLMFGGAGQTPMTQTNDLDAYKKLSPQDKIKFKQENPTLYEQFKKALGF